MLGRLRNLDTGRPRRTAIVRGLAVALVLALPLGGCFVRNLSKGYVIPEGALEQIPIGASQEQVLILMGTPSTVATVSGEVFYTSPSAPSGESLS